MRCRKCDEKILGKGYLASGMCEGCASSVVVGPEHREVAGRVFADSDPGSVERCPSCGRRLRPLSNAERQRRYRERKRT